MESLVKLENISKRFPGVQALDRVSMEILKGETHAVIGENGAGKSTLMRILAGAEIPDEGTITINDRQVEFKSPLDAQLAGIGIVYQELSIFPNLSVAENIYANRQPFRTGRFVNRKELRRKATEMMEVFSLDFDPDLLVKDLSMADRQMVEILRAASLDPRLLILDEPTSSLSLTEADKLFQLIARLHDRGIAILYVSHHLDEVLHLSQRITVLRDGIYVDTVERDRTGENELVKMMVGRSVDLYKDYGSREMSKSPVLKVDGLSARGSFSNVSFELYEGEILGFAGLVGSGRTDLAKAIFGLRDVSSGTVELLGRPFIVSSPRAAIDSGLAYVPEDRKSVGLFLEMMLTENVIAPQIHRFSKFGLINFHQVMDITQKYIEDVGIVARSPRQKAITLSGGNQQKLLLALWLASEPKVLIVDEPTRGIDVNAKVEIHDKLRDLAEKGMSIILISSELPEILTMSDRVAVMHEGILVGILDKDDANQEEIMTLASGIGKGDYTNGTVN